MSDLLQILNNYWGYDTFRPKQLEIIESIVSGKDTLVLLPTGGGKSLCYQLPAMAFQGKTLVISPLIALMQDQVDQLSQRGIPAKAIHTHVRYKDIDGILDRFVYGDLKILYISPERLASEMFNLRIAKAKLSLIAVDEAHCISQWGYDFRPAYFNIPELRLIHPNVPIIAVTATATPKVIDDMADKLQLRKANIFKQSFLRENLSLTVIKTENKKQEVLQVLSKLKGCAIIYVRNRRETIDIAQWLTQYGIECASYHGGMEKSIREKNQLVWMNNSVRIMVATNAFGMGIDKPDVRLVIHLDIAPSIEEYYQEAGRAGRDGNAAYAVTFIDDRDIAYAYSSFEDQFPSLEIIGSTYHRLCRYVKLAYGSGMMESFDFELSNFADYVSMPARKLFFILHILEKEAWITFSETYKDASKIQVMADQEDLALLQSQRDFKNELLVYLIRTYEGIFTDYVKIEEARIAQAMKKEEAYIVHILNILKAEALILYQPRASKPQITFIRERPEEDQFYMDKKSYQLRKKMAKDRLDAIIAYANNDLDCRQAFILKYFGEKPTQCGQCDLCLGSKSTTFTEKETDKIHEHLFNTLTYGAIPLKSYLELYPFHKRKRLIRMIQALESEGKISINNLGLMTWEKK